MKFPKLLSEELMLILPSSYDVLVRSFEQAKREEVNKYGDPQDHMEIVNGVAIIPVAGPIGRNLDDWDKLFGAVDVDDLADEIDEAENDWEVRSILLRIDSPGGMASGTPELADRIMQVEKPIYAYSAGLICSAAYWLASATDGIFATKSADIGSIGVYMPFYDMSELAKRIGIKVQVFSSGKYKGMGVPGTSLTSAQADLLQERIMEIAEMFYTHVQMNREGVEQETMQGQTFKADKAADNGLIDGVVRDMEEVLDMI